MQTATSPAHRVPERNEARAATAKWKADMQSGLHPKTTQMSRTSRALQRDMLKLRTFSFCNFTLHNGKQFLQGGDA